MPDSPAPGLRCGICSRSLDNPDDPLSRDCGGDCLMCMAECGDPDCRSVIGAITSRPCNWTGPDPEECDTCGALWIIGNPEPPCPRARAADVPVSTTGEGT